MKTKSIVTTSMGSRANHFPKSLQHALRHSHVLPIAGPLLAKLPRHIHNNEPFFPDWKTIARRAIDQLGGEKRRDYEQKLALLLGQSGNETQAANLAQRTLGPSWMPFLKKQFYFEKRSHRKEYGEPWQKIKPGSLAVHRLLWFLGNKGIITTNHDRSLEWAWPEPNSSERPLRFGPRDVPSDCINRLWLWCLHGRPDYRGELTVSAGSENLLHFSPESEFAYGQAMSRLKHVLPVHCVPLYVGFSMEDRHLDDLFHNLSFLKHKACILVPESQYQIMEQRFAHQKLEFVVHLDGERGLRRVLNRMVDCRDELIVKDGIHVGGMDPGLDHTREKLPNIAKKKNRFIFLWKEALTGPKLDCGDLAIRLYDDIKKKMQNKPNKALTALQSKVLQRCYGDNHPFRSRANVLICAPTSTGKTTLAKMFMMHHLFYREEKRGVLFLAPTRALAQTTYKELVKDFGRYPNPYGLGKLGSEIIVSTGEDHLDDHRLTLGDFSIACMVYEKANNLISYNHQWLENIGCIVIDELHMLRNPVRGPSLELMMTKIQHAMRHSDKVHPVRTICLSTSLHITRYHRRWLVSEELAPIFIESASRPVPLRHCLVLPGVLEKKAYVEEEIGYFHSQPILSAARSLQLKNKLRRLWRCHRHHHHHDKWELVKRLDQFLPDLVKRGLDKHSNYSLMVFLPSKDNIYTLARYIAGLLRDRQAPQWALIEEDVFRRWQRDTEHHRPAVDLAFLACYGVFIHHADLDRQMRGLIESLLTGYTEFRPLPAPLILLSTQTLSYGMNFPVQDVIISGQGYPCRDRRLKIKFEPLDLCDFQNMAGRCGRLGFGQKRRCSVYYLPKIRDSTATLDYYYGRRPRLESSLFSTRDLPVDEQQKRNVNSRETMYSGTLTRVILEALSYLTDEKSPGWDRNYAAPNALNKLVHFSLYKHLNWDSSQYHEFISVIPNILKHLSRICPKVVIKRQRCFRVGELGRSVLITGMLPDYIPSTSRHINHLETQWARVFPGEAFPVILLLFPVIAQEDLINEGIRAAPEGDGSLPWDENMVAHNIELVWERLTRDLARLTGKHEKTLAPFVGDYQQFLKKTYFPPLASYLVKYRYEGGPAEVVARHFSALAHWIMMQPKVDVLNQILRYDEPGEPASHRYGKLTSWQSYTYKVSWRLLFVLSLYNTSEVRRGLQPWETSLRTLSRRVKLGTEPDGIHLTFPATSALSRVCINRLLAQRWTPSNLLNFPDAVLENLDVEKKQMLLYDLSRLAHKHFKAQRFHYTEAAWEYKEQTQIDSLWDQVYRLFLKSLDDYSSHLSKTDGVTSLTPIRHKIPDYGADVICAPVQRDWRISLERGPVPFDQFLGEERDARTLWLVLFPWCPSQESLSKVSRELLEERQRQGLRTAILNPACYAAFRTNLSLKSQPGGLFHYAQKRLLPQLRFRDLPGLFGPDYQIGLNRNTEQFEVLSEEEAPEHIDQVKFDQSPCN